VFFVSPFACDRFCFPMWQVCLPFFLTPWICCPCASSPKSYSSSPRSVSRGKGPCMLLCRTFPVPTQSVFLEGCFFGGVLVLPERRRFGVCLAPPLLVFSLPGCTRAPFAGVTPRSPPPVHNPHGRLIDFVRGNPLPQIPGRRSDALGSVGVRRPVCGRS